MSAEIRPLAMSGPPSVRAPSWDSLAATVACITGCCAAYGAYFGLPLLLGAVATSVGFNEGQLGWVGSAESLGLLVGSGLASAFAKSGRFRLLVLAGAAAAVCATVAVLFTHAFPWFVGLRLVAGIGNGVCYSASVACLARTSNPSRNFAALVITLVVVNSLELWALPYIRAVWGLVGMYGLLAAAFVVPAVLCLTVPNVVPVRHTLSVAAADATQPTQVPMLRQAWACLAGVALFNVAASAFWAYAERIGALAGLGERPVSTTLTICNLLSLGGSALAYPVGRRAGQYRPLLIATAVVVGVYAWWSTSLTAQSYIFGVFVFFEVWAMVAVFQLGTLGAIDPVGRGVALVPAAQGIGQSAGPFLAGLLLAGGGTFSQVLAVSSGFALASALTCGAVYLSLRHASPALAAA